MPNDTDKRTGGVPLVELLFEYLLPIVGGVLSVCVARACGLSLGWALLIGLPGAIAFQWAAVGLLVLVARYWPGRHNVNAEPRVPADGGRDRRL
jgi:hypothetical protein